MGYIKQLSEDLIKKIAAGEVIERPASVVKELVENSIDAGATKIEIEVERGGKYIKVSDNGKGIDPEDIPLLFSRHATSKLNSFDDLWDIESLGFRGEALASISSVSKITCKSKHLDHEYGFRINISGTNIEKKSYVISIGTVFEIDDLFYNVPARQKFLKSESTETGHIYDVVVSLALSHPKVSFLLSVNKKEILKTSTQTNLTETITELLGEDLKNKLINVTGKNNFSSFEGYISALEIYRNDKKSIFIFINKRPVKCPIISKAVSSAFEGLLPSGKSPAVVLNLSFKPKFVDINVHPSKKEVRYTNPNDVYNLILYSLQNAISNHYKKVYKENSVYSFASPSNTESVHESPSTSSKPQVTGSESKSSAVSLPTSTINHSYTEAAIAFYSPAEKTEYSLFSVPHLRCKVIISDKPITNITRLGNKTIFEIGLIFDASVQIVFSGEITGDQNYQKNFFNYLSDLSRSIYSTYKDSEIVIQKKIISGDPEEEEVKEIYRKKPPDSILYKVWERDNWTCVYCGKQLIDPKTARESLPHSKSGFKTYINARDKEITISLIKEHVASYDHLLPASKLPQFNFEEENLFACCQKCNKEKSDSMSLKAWQPKRQNKWETPLEVAGIKFNTPKEFIKG